MQPTRAIRKASRASEGTVCRIATDAEQRAGRTRPAPGGDADRHAHRHRGHERAEHQQQVLGGEPAEVGREQARPEPGFAARPLCRRSPPCARRGRGHAAAGEEARRDLGEAAAVELDLAVHRDHGRGVDAIPPGAQRRGVDAACASAARRRTWERRRGRPRAPAGRAARAWHRSSRRRSRRPCRPRPRRRRGRGRGRSASAAQRVGRLQRRPAVGALQELVRQAEPQRAGPAAAAGRRCARCRGSSPALRSSPAHRCC